MTKEYIEQFELLSTYITLMDSESLELIKSLISEELMARKLLKKVKEWQ